MFIGYKRMEVVWNYEYMAITMMQVIESEEELENMVTEK